MPNPMSTSEIVASLDFGDYCEIEQKRYGAPNEFYRYKVIGRSNSNYYNPVPVDANGNHKAYGDMCETVKVICCGVAEERVETFRLCDVRAIESPKAIAALQAQGRKPAGFLVHSQHSKTPKYVAIERTARNAAELYGWTPVYLAPPAQAARVPDEWISDIREAAKHIAEFESGPSQLAGSLYRISDGLAAPAPAEKAAIPLNEHTRAIFGRPNFTCIKIANRLREMGHDIPRKAEEEQATVIHFLLTHYLNNGNQWRTSAESALRRDDTPAAPGNGEAGKQPEH